MPPNARTLVEAEFNPDVKKYLNIFGILILFATIIGIPFILFWVLIAPYFINKYFERLECELTTRSLRFKKGYIFHTEKNIPLDKIQDLTFKEGPLLRAFGLSIMKIETAGSSGAQGISDLTLIGIIDAAGFRARVLEQRDEVTDLTGKTPVSSDPDSSIKILKEIRDSLRRLEKKLG